MDITPEKYRAAAQAHIAARIAELQLKIENLRCLAEDVPGDFGPEIALIRALTEGPRHGCRRAGPYVNTDGEIILCLHIDTDGTADDIYAGMPPGWTLTEERASPGAADGLRDEVISTWCHDDGTVAWLFVTLLPAAEGVAA